MMLDARAALDLFLLSQQALEVVRLPGGGGSTRQGRCQGLFL
jgi:hypothetical protein